MQIITLAGAAMKTSLNGSSLEKKGGRVMKRVHLGVAIGMLALFGFVVPSYAGETTATMEKMKGEAKGTTEEVKGQAKGAVEDVKGNKATAEMERAKGKAKGQGERAKGEVNSMKEKAK
jgi:hypothetical protein